MRRRHQPAIPSATNLTPLNSLRSSAIQPASTPNLVAASLQARWLVAGSLQARWLAYCLLKEFELRCDRGPQVATGRHRIYDSLVLRPPQINENPPRPAQIHRKSINPHWIPEIKRASPPGCYLVLSWHLTICINIRFSRSQNFEHHFLGSRIMNLAENQSSHR